MLDAQEYLSLAVNASQVQDHHAALEYLNLSLQLEPENPLALYLRAAEHAELGLLDRGIEGMENALDIEPKLVLARLQLAMLYMQTSKNEPAQSHLKVIGSSESSPELVSYAKGFLALLEGDKQTALHTLQRACDMPQEFPALQAVIVKFIESNTDAVPETTKVKQAQQTEKNDNTVFLGAYRSTEDD